MQDALLRLDVAANNIANVNTENFEPSRVVSAEAAGGGVTSVVTRAGPPDLELPPSGTHLATELVSLTVARIAFETSAAALRAAQDSHRSVLDMLT